MKKLFFIILAVFLLTLYTVSYHGGNIAAVIPLAAVSIIPACAAFFPILRLLDVFFPSKEKNTNRTKTEKERKSDKVKNDQINDEDIFTTMFSFD